jgi:hypothetical protein
MYLNCVGKAELLDNARMHTNPFWVNIRDSGCKLFSEGGDAAVKRSKTFEIVP